MDYGFHYSTSNYDEGEDYLVKKTVEVLHDPCDLHFMYESLIIFYSNYLKYHEGAADKLVMVCRLDIEYYFRFIDAWQARYRNDRLPIDPLSFNTLWRYYENRGLYYEAIDICYAAIEYEIRDYTIDGYTERLARLEKRLEEQLKYS
ncbi:hypothetical protein A3844_01940 [Paenibacillus helianthi]|uniref:Uncharacterized protein n=1 Tax=Paenibacillus helianthi TaxID=1349432 RepID=A0ABX3EUR9_9BACL|nr:hypothetical protein [Paenibacillus helianthi]OKP91899.1 hypothetical protein A3844_01940 [Paenibacillus helianthi]